MMIGASRRIVLKSTLANIRVSTPSARLFSSRYASVLQTPKRSQLFGLITKTSQSNGTRAGGAALLHHANVRSYATNTEDAAPVEKSESLQVLEAAEPTKAVEASTASVGENLMTDAASTSSQSALDQAAQTSSEGIIQAAAQLGDFKTMGLCNFTPVGGLEAMLEAIHVYSGLPWWGSIAVATIVVRLALLPLMIKIQRNNARLMNINPDVTRIMANLKAAQAQGDSMATGKYTHEIQDLFKKNECHPMKSLALPIVQMPVMISFFMALRAMAELPVPGMKDGGMLWFTDLSDKDPYYILPVVSAAGVMAVLEAGTEAGAANPQSKGMKNLFRGLTVVMVPFTAWMPSAVFVYWVTSNAFSIFQILGLKNQSVRNALNIPKLVKPPAELQKDTKGFFENFKEQQVLHEKSEKERILRERQQAAAMARRASKRRF